MGPSERTGLLFILLNLEAAREDVIKVMKTYRAEIRNQELRSDTSRNGFVKTCCQQEIDQLKAEKEAIEAEVIG